MAIPVSFSFLTGNPKCAGSVYTCLHLPFKICLMSKSAEHLEFQSTLMPQIYILVAEPFTLEVLPEACSIHYSLDLMCKGRGLLSVLQGCGKDPGLSRPWGCTSSSRALLFGPVRPAPNVRAGPVSGPLTFLS